MIGSIATGRFARSLVENNEDQSSSPQDNSFDNNDNFSDIDNETTADEPMAIARIERPGSSASSAISVITTARTVSTANRNVRPGRA